MIERNRVATFAADAMPVFRMVAAPIIARYLITTPPEQRSWRAGRRVGFTGATDKGDGLLSEIAGPTARGARLDEEADKVLMDLNLLALAYTGEIPPAQAVLNITRDIAVTAMRRKAASEDKQTASIAVNAASGQYRPNHVAVDIRGKRKTAVGLSTLAIAASPLSKNPDNVRAGISNYTAMSVTSGINYATKYFKNKSDKQKSDTSNPRNGKVRELFTKPVNALVTELDEKFRNLTPSHITKFGEVCVMTSVIMAVLNPDKVVLPTAGYAVGSGSDGLDGELARLKARKNGQETTVEGMIEDVKADKRQEIFTLAGLAIIAMRRRNRVAAQNYAAALRLSVATAYYRAKAEARGYIVSEDGEGGRVATAVLCAAGIALNANRDASDMISATILTNKINTVSERRDVVNNGENSPYCAGINNDPKFMEHARIRVQTLEPLDELAVKVGNRLLLLSATSGRLAKFKSYLSKSASKASVPAKSGL